MIILKSTRFACLLAVLIALGAGCTPQGDGNTEPVTIELATYGMADIAPAPSGTGEIIGGMVIVDFDDALGLEAIDATLEAQGLERAGYVGGVNVVTARILDGSGEEAVRDRLDVVAGVEGAALNYVLRQLARSGAVPPVLASPQSPPPEALQGADMLVNWPHWIMDTFPAHALADEVLGAGVLSDVVIAIVDIGGFHDQATDGQASGSIFSTSADGDLAGKMVEPIAIVSGATSGMPEPRTGPATTASNSLVTSAGSSSHGLFVASAAAGSGEDILGTSRHARVKPVFLSADTAQGRCSNDTTLSCSRSNPCSRVPGAGVCEGIAGMDFLVASAAALADTLSAADAANLRVVNFSMGFNITAADRDSVRRVLEPVFRRLVDGNRVVVMAADNNPGDTTLYVPTLLAPARSANRSTLASPEVGIVLVAGTSMPEGNAGEILLLGADEYANLDFMDMEERPWDNSATGENVTISAPAEFVPVLMDDLSTRRVIDGNSFAAPYVAGVAAELIALDPTVTNLEVIEILTATADRIIDPTQPDALGAGRLNAWKAVLRLLSRDDLADPDWVGVRFRFAGEAAPDDRIVLNGSDVPDVVWKRVPDVPRELDSNAREVPDATVLPASLSASFSFSTDEFDTLEGNIGMLELVSSTGSPRYQVPLRMAELLSVGDRPLDTLLDNLVVTFDIHTDLASVFGRVTDDAGQPVAGATIEYTSIFDQVLFAETDEDGYYIIYDALPDVTFELTASNGDVASIVDVQIDNHMALRQDFVLVGEDEPVDDMPDDPDDPDDPVEGCDALGDSFAVEASLDGGALTCAGSGRTVIVEFTGMTENNLPVFPATVVVEGVMSGSVPCRSFQDCDPVESTIGGGTMVSVSSNVFCDDPPDGDQYGAVYLVRVTDDCGRTGAATVVLLCCTPEDDCNGICGG